MTDTAVAYTTSEKTDFSVKTHFNRAWSIFKATVLRMFLFQLVGGALGLILMLVWVGIIVGAVFGNETVRTAFQTMTQGNFSALLAVPWSFWRSIIVTFTVFAAVYTFLLTPFFSAGLILVASDADKKYSFGQILGKSLRLIPSLAVFLLVLFLINIGTTYLFIVPGMIVGILLSFGVYEVVLANKSPLDALRSSLALVKNEFWLVLGRGLLLMVVFMVVFYVMPSLMNSISSALGGLYQVLVFIPSFCSGWFAVAYTMALYTHVKHSAPKNASAGIWWIVLLAVLGWLMLIATVMGVIKLIKSPKFQQAIQKELSSLKQEATSSAQFKTDFDQDIQYEYTQSDDLQPTFAPRRPTAYPTKKQTVVPTCTNYNIREGEFASNKCYTSQDYEDLFYYLGRFQTAQSQLRGAEATIEITCNGSEFFKQSCDQAQASKTAAEADISKYRATIQGIIAKGK